MPQALEHDLELRDRGLVVILPEVQGASLDQLPVFLWRTFPKLEARVCAGGNVPIVRGRGIPYSALIGVDGRLLWAGSPSAGGRERDELIEAELRKTATGWGASPAARKVRAQLYGKRDLAEAKRLLAAAVEAQDEEAPALAKEIDVALAWRRRMVDVLVGEGRFVEARAAARALQKSVAGVPEWEQEAARAVETFATPELERELALGKRIEMLLRAAHGKKMQLEDAERRLRSIAASGNGTRSGERAANLADTFAAAAKRR